MDQFKSPMQYVLRDLTNTPKVWPTLLLMITVCAFTIAIPKLYYFHFKPSLVDLLRKDRNTRWEKKTPEPYEAESPNISAQSPMKFDFDSSIVLGGWCDSRFLQEG